MVKTSLPLGLHNHNQNRSTASFDAHQLVNLDVKLRCQESIHVDAHSDPSLRCPEECPLWAELHGESFSCDFTCVPASRSACIQHSPHSSVPDQKLGVCRPCQVMGCLMCREDGTDNCEECTTGHVLVDGQCLASARYGWWVGMGFLIFIVSILTAWLMNLVCQPTVNQQNLELGLASRSRSKLLMPAESKSNAPSSNPEQDPDEDQHVREEPASRRGLWPLDTNLMTESVAGPGLMAHFNFQFATVVWGLAVAAGWAILGLAVDWQLVNLGLEAPTTPRSTCINVSQGYWHQQRLMWVKVRFVFVVYLLSTLMALAFSVAQLRLFRREDVKSVTHKDFCAKCKGLPQLSGSQKVEEDLKLAISKATGQSVVGVSVCWDFKEVKWLVMEWVEADLRVLSHRRSLSLGRDAGRRAVFERNDEGLPFSVSGWMRNLFTRMERIFISPPVQRFITRGRTGGQRDLRRAGLTRQYVEEQNQKDDSEEEADVETVLSEMLSSDTAFVVFETEAARDAAVKSASKGSGIQFQDYQLSLEAADLEPCSVLWQNCEYPNPCERLRRGSIGFLMLIAAEMVWLGVFFLPYAMHSVFFNYKYGMVPNALSTGFFSMVVVAGNAIMYVACGEIANYLKFQSVDMREVFYMLMYTFATVVNVVLDLIVTYYVAYFTTVGVGVRTHDGQHLSEVTGFTQRFQTFAMQRELGSALLSYAFPSTFLLPFIAEPVLTVYLPYKIMRLIVKGNSSFVGAYAESCLMAGHMDLSRYGDISLNLVLASLIFFFPGGYILPMFLALAVSHLWVYAYDHFRVLRCVQTFHFANITVDWWAQWMLSIPCGAMLSCLVLKANCSDGAPCHADHELIFRCGSVFMLHVVMHTLALVYLVPCFAQKTSEEGVVQTYAECNKRLSGSWFTTNPVFCLRSKYVYTHDPPCDYCAAGQEHLLRPNPEIGQHFEDCAAASENYDVTVDQLSKRISDQLTASWRRLSGDRREVLKS